MFYAFHVLNAWEERVEAKGQAEVAPTYQSLVKIITCDMFEFDFESPVNTKAHFMGELLFKSEHVD